MLEDHLYWVLVYWRWMNDANFERGPGELLQACAGDHPPAGRNGRCAAKCGAACMRMASAVTHEAEMTAMSDRAFDALSQVLGDNRYLMGDEPCGADATAFAFIAGALCPLFESPAHDKRASLTEPRRVPRPHDGGVLPT